MARQAKQEVIGTGKIGIGTALLLVCPCAPHLCGEGRQPPGSPATLSRSYGT